MPRAPEMNPHQNALAADLHAACYRMQPQAVEQLLAAGADPNFSLLDETGKLVVFPALWHAIAAGSYEPEPQRRAVFQALARGGADPARLAQDPAGGPPRPPLSEAFRMSRLGAAEDLLAAFPPNACARRDDLWQILGELLRRKGYSAGDEGLVSAALDILIPSIRSFGEPSFPRIQRHLLIPNSEKDIPDPFLDFPATGRNFSRSVMLSCSPAACAWISGLDQPGAKLLIFEGLREPPIAPPLPGGAPPFPDHLALIQWLGETLGRPFRESRAAIERIALENESPSLSLPGRARSL